jgi:hypothetical protein
VEDVMSDCMVYVAADPKQPGAAWAICIDKPEWAKDTAKSIAGWIKEGAQVQRVDLETGKAMLMKWVRPSKAKQEELL